MTVKAFKTDDAHDAEDERQPKCGQCQNRGTDGAFERCQ